jgi:hypothetical protein
MIPKTARNCAFCSARQEVPTLGMPVLGVNLPAADDSDASDGEEQAGAPAESITAALASAAEAAAAAQVTPPVVEAPAIAIAPSVEPLVAVAPPDDGELERRASAVTPRQLRATSDPVAAPAAPSEKAAAAPEVAAGSEAERAGEPAASHRHSSQTSKTLFGIEVDTQALVAAAEADAALERRADEPRPDEAAEAAEADDGADRPEPDDDEWEEEPRVSWAVVGRTVMALAGIVLLALYVSSYKLMVALAGPQIALQHYSLGGGLVLLAASLMDLPARFRAAVSAGLGAVPLFLVGPSLVGFDGWRGLAAALVFLVLPGALFLRARATGSRLARLLVAVAVVLIALIYLVPTDDVVPAAAALALVRSGSIAGVVTGAIFLSPLLLGALALTAFAGRDSTGFGALWACLVLLVAPGAIIAAGFADGDASLVHVGVALLAAGATAAVGLAQLLAPPPQIA